MEAKVGDRVSLDAKKVGQPRRTGVIRAATKGLSGMRYQVSWDDGTNSVISPGAGILLIEGKAKAVATSRSTKRAAKAPAKGSRRKR